MFIQHKQLKNLTVAAEKVDHLHASSSRVQLAFAGFPPQLCSAYLLQIKGPTKALIVVAFYLTDSRSSIFFVPKYGEVELSDAEGIYEEGYSFIESMGFILTETDYHLLSAEKKKPYWDVLPICQPPQLSADPKQRIDTERAVLSSKDSKEIQALSDRSRDSLGRFLASM
jgi:hypothetical protein